jgi:hypothetical protein
MIKLIPTEIVQYILDKTENIINFLSLTLTCNHFYDMDLIPKFNQTKNQPLPKFILTEKWAKLLYSKNKNFILPKNYTNDGFYKLYPKLICNNSLYE